MDIKEVDEVPPASGGSTPAFEVVPTREANRVKVVRRDRRDWVPVVDALVAGRTLWFRDEDLTEADLKYLELALGTRQSAKGRPALRLRRRRDRRPSGLGRIVWSEPKE